jgi:cytochrome c oxidase subunit II
MFFSRLLGLSTLLSLITHAASAEAPAHPGMAVPNQLGLQAPVTPVMEKLYHLHNDILLPLIIVISIFVLVLLAYTCIRFRAKRNPVPSKTTHNTLIEFIWITVPILILGAIFVPSLRIHYFMDKAHKAEMTLKVTGYQWYWGYEYPDQGNISFESHIFPNAQDPARKVSIEQDNAELKGEPRLLTVDNPAVVPVDTEVRVLTTASDVIHSWAMPSFGIKIDAIPGRVNETWFKATQTGTFRGQCSQLCGVWHGFMPVVIKVVTKEEFAKWVEEKKKSASAESPAVLAQAH